MSRAKTSKTDILIKPQSLTMLKILLKTSAFKSLYGGKCTLWVGSTKFHFSLSVPKKSQKLKVTQKYYWGSVHPYPIQIFL